MKSTISPSFLFQNGIEIWVFLRSLRYKKLMKIEPELWINTLPYYFSLWLSRIDNYLDLFKKSEILLRRKNTIQITLLKWTWKWSCKNGVEYCKNAPSRIKLWTYSIKKYPAKGILGPDTLIWIQSRAHYAKIQNLIETDTYEVMMGESYMTYWDHPSRNTLLTRTPAKIFRRRY